MALMTKLPQSVVEEDHRLDTATEKASERLAKHRWHWTLDQTNAERVSLKEYARSVGRAFSTIRNQVEGYATWEANGRARSLNEEVQRANVGTEKEAATEAIAKARGLSYSRVQQDRGSEVRRVRDAARDAAERKGTSVADEVATVAQVVVAGEEADRKAEVEHKERRSLRYIEVERHLLSALRTLRLAQVTITDVPFDAEERELLRSTVESVRQLIGLIDARLSGTEKIDWDAELNKIMEGVH